MGFCEKLRHEADRGRGGPGDQDMQHLHMDCETGELSEFCTDLKMYLKSDEGATHFNTPEMVQLRKFCGGLEAMLDRSTRSDAPFAASELVKERFEDGFTLYDNPPEVPFKHYKGYASKGKSIYRGLMTVEQAKGRCMKMPKCKGFRTRGLLWGVMGKGAQDDSKGLVELIDQWEDPLGTGLSAFGNSYKKVGFLKEPPWLNTMRFSAPMRRVFQEGPSS